MQAQYGDLYGEDDTWEGLEVLALKACTVAQGNRMKNVFKEVESFRTLAQQSTSGGLQFLGASWWTGRLYLGCIHEVTSP